jgi:hypothetical protein
MLLEDFGGPIGLNLGGPITVELDFGGPIL